MSHGAWRPAALAFAAAFGVELGCTQRQAWQQDESRRIGDVISSQKYPDDAELKGTSFAAPPSTAPPLETSSYQIQGASSKQRTKPHRNSRGAAKRKGRRDEQVTSPKAGEDGVSRRP